MKSIKITSIALAFSLAVVFSAFAAQEQNTPGPGGIVVDVTEWSGEVTAIDYQTKMVTLKGPEGKVVTLHAKNAQNLDQVKAGDIVKVKFIDSLAIFVRKADSPAGRRRRPGRCACAQRGHARRNYGPDHANHSRCAGHRLPEAPGYLEGS